MVCGLQRNALTQKTEIAARWRLWLSVIIMSDHRSLVITTSKHTQSNRRSILSHRSNLPLADISQSRAKKPHVPPVSPFWVTALSTGTSLTVAFPQPHHNSQSHCTAVLTSIPLYVLWTKKKAGKCSSRSSQTAVQRSKRNLLLLVSLCSWRFKQLF